jgi:hypothetical protein
MPVSDSLCLGTLVGNFWWIYPSGPHRTGSKGYSPVIFIGKPPQTAFFTFELIFGLKKLKKNLAHIRLTPQIHPRIIIANSIFNMKNIYKLTSAAALLAPVFMSATLVDVTKPGTSTSFNNLISDMYSDQSGILVGTGSSPSRPNLFTEFYFDNSPGVNEFTLDAINLGATDTYNFELIATNVEYFTMSGVIDIGFFANEAWDVNKLSVDAYNNVADISNLGPVVETEEVFRYSDISGDETPPLTAQISAEDDGDLPIIIQFIHENLTTTGFGVGTQDDEVRFRMYQLVEGLDQTGARIYGDTFVLSISDREGTLDGDFDDGMFLLQGSIAPVPEPSHIAGLAILGLAGILYIRRRSASKK